jgi:hypothetical protein
MTHLFHVDSQPTGRATSRKRFCVGLASALLGLMPSSFCFGETTGDLVEEVVDYDSDTALFHNHGSGPACINCEAFQPRWMLNVGAVSMDRITADSQPLIQYTGALARQINADSFDFDWQAGLDVSLMRKSWDESAWEIRYLDLGTQRADASLTNAPNQVRFNAAPTIFAPNVQRIDASYENDLASFELNFHYPLYDHVEVLAGFRHVSLDDDLRTRLHAAPQTFLYEDRTENDLYGGQVGASTLPHPFSLLSCCCWSAFAKAGVYGNDGSHRGFIDTGATQLAIRDSFGDVSFVGEFGANTRLQIGDFAILGGYSLLWLEHVAIASDQLAVSNYFSGTGSDLRGSALYHGATLAIEYQH